MGNNELLHLVWFILSIFLLWLEITTTTAISHHPVSPGARNYKCMDKERDALLDFKAYIDQDPYGFLSTWTAEDRTTNDCCKWIGVTCNNQTGHVIGLDLVDGDLEGKISPSLVNLTYLNDLNLFGNSLNGTIPMFIGSMTQLRYLDLGSNLFSGIVPPELGNLTNLQEFSLQDLRRCTIENLDWLSHLSNLKTLDMSGVSLAKEIHLVNVILRLHKLLHLSLDRCELSHVMHTNLYSYFNSSSSSIVTLSLVGNNLNSSMYHWLFPLTSNRLVDLDLSRNKLDRIPKYLGNLCSLRYLHIGYNSMPAKFPDFLNNLSGCTTVTLQWLDASSSQFTGSISDEIRKFSSLQTLDLSHNQLNGTISDKVWQLPSLQLLIVSSNSLKGAISENIGKSKIFSIDISNNLLEGVHSGAHMSNLSTCQVIDLSSCKLGPRFPIWIHILKNLTRINIADTRISDTIPEEFWYMWPSQLTYLNLSSNNITGKVTNLLSNFNSGFSVLDLSSNNFYGLVPNVSSTLQRLDLSKNKFYGEISFLCQIIGGSLYFLDLSHNSFTGEIPDCLWQFKELIVLNIGHNNLSGSLPASIGYMLSLEHLYLNNNSFSGELPLSLQNCTNLSLLELGANKFSGHVPVWIGEKLSWLYVLSLRSNTFFGTIPSQLCQLQYLQVIDLSMNNLYGTIPSCLNNLTAMVKDELSVFQNFYPNNCVTSVCTKNDITDDYVDSVIIKWQGSVHEFSSNLGLLTSIDLSSNNLTGHIPYELTSLYGLIALNLSNNAIFGEIPQNISGMKKLLALDLSRNNFSGALPLSMSQMNFLSYLDVSYNDLSGRIPSGTQLQSFEASRYTENARLCGPPLTKYCPGDKELEAPDLGLQSEGVGEEIDELERSFYIGGASGFLTGFCIACALLANRHGRKAFFGFMDSLKDWFYIKVMVFIANWKRATHA